MILSQSQDKIIESTTKMALLEEKTRVAQRFEVYPSRNSSRRAELTVFDYEMTLLAWKR